MATLNYDPVQCPLCLMEPVKTGRTMLLLKDDFCFIDMNDKTALVIDGCPIFAKTRLSLCLLEHTSIPEEETVRRAKERLVDFLTGQLQLTPDVFIIRITMLTYPQHFHIHAYLLPFVDEYGASVEREVFESSTYTRNFSVPDHVCNLVNQPWTNS